MSESRTFSATCAALALACAVAVAFTSASHAENGSSDTPRGESRPDARTPSEGEAGEGKTGEADAKEGDEKKDGEKKDGEKKDGDAEDAKPAEATYDDVDDYDALMRLFSRMERIGRRAVRDKDTDRMTDTADRVRFYATRIVHHDADKEGRAKAEDYLGWAKELETNARSLRVLAEAAAPDWDKIEAAWEAVQATCKSCHDVYEK